jgi:hypothetical protein
MKQTHQLMSIFLILLISSSLQIKIKQNLIENPLDHRTGSDEAQTNDEMHSEVSESQLSPSQNNLENDHLENEDQMNNSKADLNPFKKIADGFKKLVKKGVDKVMDATKYDTRADDAKMREKNNRTKPKNSYGPLPTQTVILDKATKWNESLQWVLAALDRHNVDCPEDYSALNSFKLEINNQQKIRYKYQCVQSASITNNCRDYQTDIKTAEFLVAHSLDTLVKHYVKCPDNTVMKGFEMVALRMWNKENEILRLTRDRHPRLYYSYTCCDANISRRLLARTGETKNANNEFFELEHQTIQALDKNAITYFHMQAPGKKIFFEMEFATLKGETSPSYPDYFNQNSQAAAPNGQQGGSQTDQTGQQDGKQVDQSSQQGDQGQNEQQVNQNTQQNTVENNPQPSFTGNNSIY